MQAAMTSRRNRSISTKVTDAEYEQVVAHANPKTVSEWARAILINASEPVDIEFLLLAEFLALRTIVMNLHFALAEGGPVPSTEAMKRLVERADAEKVNRAHRHIAQLKGAADVAGRWTGNDKRS
jgi:hypothetical protein